MSTLLRDVDMAPGTRREVWLEKREFTKADKCLS